MDSAVLREPRSKGKTGYGTGLNQIAAGAAPVLLSRANDTCLAQFCRQ